MKWKVLAAALVFALGLPPAFLLVDGVSEIGRTPGAHMGNLEGLFRNFVEWGRRHETNGGDANVVLGLAWNKDLSLERTEAHGLATLDLIRGSVQVRVWDLDPSREWDVWLIDGQADREKDRKIRLGTLVNDGNEAYLWRFLGGDFFTHVEIDSLQVARAGEDLDVATLLYGAPSLFQWLHTRARVAESNPHPLTVGGVDSILGPRPAFAQISATPVLTLDQLIAKGEDLFFNGTFGGNGRTCGTCHPAENNFTIDPKFIATLPDNDPLFVAEDPTLPLAGLEKPALMRRFGVILENLDGFDAPEDIFVMRGVPHTLALPTSLTPAPDDPNNPGFQVDGTTVPPVERTGWSGDGAPGNGSLFRFAEGAVRQHFTKSLNRVPGVDFVFPTLEELRAMEAFQLSLGRQSEFDLTISFSDPIVQLGVTVFNGNGACRFCHASAGANSLFDGTNHNFDTGIERQLNLPIQTFDPSIPRDGGFGAGDCVLPGDIGIGNCTFNTPTLVEAADTGPFFHNNSMDTIEAAVSFYNTQDFANSGSGFPIFMSGSEVQAVASLLRAINAQENLRNAVVQEQKALTVNDINAFRRLIEIGIAETEDAIEVLEGANLHLDLIPDLELAIDHLTNLGPNSVQQAIALQNAVHDAIGM